MIKYYFRQDEPLRIRAAAEADPQIVGEALEDIRAASGGQLEPQAVVDAARALGHPLHRHFEWDDRKAAEAHRLDQARGIIRIVRVKDSSTEDGFSRAFISINDASGVSYRAVREVKKSLEMQTALMAAADRDLEAFQVRYRELKDICKFVLEAREALKRRRSGAKESRAHA